MTDEELNIWERQPNVCRVLISREMGAWLKRRDENKAKQQPTVCDIEQIRDKAWADAALAENERLRKAIDIIRAEIEQLHYHPKLDFIKNDEVVDMALEIIDRQIGDKE